VSNSLVLVFSHTHYAYSLLLSLSLCHSTSNSSTLSHTYSVFHTLNPLTKILYGTLHFLISHTLTHSVKLFFTFPAALTLTHQYIPSYPLTLETFCLFHILLCIYSISIIVLSPTRCTYSHFRTLLCLYYDSLILFCSLTLSLCTLFPLLRCHSYSLL